MLQEALFSVISSLQEWEAPFLVFFLPMGIELLSQLTTFPFLSLKLCHFGMEGTFRDLLCPEDLPPAKTVLCYRSSLYFMDSAHTQGGLF